MRRLGAAQHDAARPLPDRGRRHGERRHRGRAGRLAAPARAHSRRSRSSPTDISRRRARSRAENAVGHAVADRIAFAEADLLPDGAGAVRPRAGQPAVRPERRDPGPAQRRLVRAVACARWRRRTGSRSSRGCSTACRSALASRRHGAARDRGRPGRGHRRARRGAPARLVVCGRDRPGRPAAGRSRAARAHPLTLASASARRSGIIIACPRS